MVQGAFPPPPPPSPNGATTETTFLLKCHVHNTYVVNLILITFWIGFFFFHIDLFDIIFCTYGMTLKYFFFILCFECIFILHCVLNVRILKNLSSYLLMKLRQSYSNSNKYYMGMTLKNKSYIYIKSDLIDAYCTYFYIYYFS